MIGEIRNIHACIEVLVNTNIIMERMIIGTYQLVNIIGTYQMHHSGQVIKNITHILIAPFKIFPCV